MKGLNLGLLLSKVVSIDDIPIGIASVINIRHELESNPVLSLEIVINEEQIQTLIEHLYMIDIMQGDK